MRRAFPELPLIELDASALVFHSFFSRIAAQVTLLGTHASEFVSLL